MKKKIYERPSVEVIVLNQEPLMQNLSGEVPATLGGFENQTLSRKSRFLEIEFPDEDF